MIQSAKLGFATAKRIEVVNITPKVAEIVARSRIAHGLCTVHSLHTTLGVAVNEDEPLLMGDMERWLEEIVRDDPEAPQFGQHTEEVLLEVAGYSWEEISQPRELGVI